MSRNRIVLMVLLWVGSFCALIAAALYSYTHNVAVWHLSPRLVTTPDVVLILVILVIDVIVGVRLYKKPK